jgi:hypothetical protein
LWVFGFTSLFILKLKKIKIRIKNKEEGKGRWGMGRWGGVGGEMGRCGMGRWGKKRHTLSVLQNILDFFLHASRDSCARLWFLIYCEYTSDITF